MPARHARTASHRALLGQLQLCARWCQPGTQPPGWLSARSGSRRAGLFTDHLHPGLSCGRRSRQPAVVEHSPATGISLLAGPSPQRAPRSGGLRAEHDPYFQSRRVCSSGGVVGTPAQDRRRCLRPHPVRDLSQLLSFAIARTRAPRSDAQSLSQVRRPARSGGVDRVGPSGTAHEPHHLFMVARSRSQSVQPGAQKPRLAPLDRHRRP